MHPQLSPYGAYMMDFEEPPWISIDLTGLSGMLATRILGEVWKDDYAGYEYNEGDEAYVEVIMVTDCTYEDEYYLDEDDAE